MPVSDETYTAQKVYLQFLQMPLMQHLCHSYTETSSRRRIAYAVLLIHA